MTKSRSSRIRTTDLTLATFLIFRGHKPEKMEKAGETRSGWPIGAWIFRGGAQLQGDLNKYSSGLAKVEPLGFHKKLKTTRRDMYEALGVSQGDRS